MESLYLTIDLESRVFGEKCSKLSPLQRKKTDNNYVLNSTEKILGILKSFDAKITFFVLGELYEWYPELIEKILEEGHEVAYHGHSHKLITSKQDLSDSINQSKAFLKKIKPIGFRAPCIFLPKDCLSVLKKNGFVYDSSVYGSRFHRLDGLLEIPVSSYPLFGEKALIFPQHLALKKVLTEVPFGSGYFLALLGENVSFFINNFKKKKLPTVLFIHNWQVIKQNYPLPLKEAINPLQFPYLLNIERLFSYLLKNFEVKPISEGIKDGDFNER